MADLRQIIEAFYPEIHQRTYCVPPVYFNRVPYRRETVAGQPVLVTREPVGGLPANQPSSSTGQPAAPSSHVTPVSQTVSAATSHTPSPTMIFESRTNTPTLKSDLTASTHDDLNFPVASSSTTADENLSPKSSASDIPVSVQTALQQTPPQTDQGSPRVLPARGMWTLENDPGSVPDQVFYNDLREDFAQQHVLHCLQKLGEEQKAAMFIVSQLNFTNYLNKPSYAAAMANVPRPADLHRDFRRGDFDVLLFHQQYGILIGEIKSVGLNDAELNKPQAQSDADVAKRVLRAVKQLNKSEKVVKHMVSDVAPDVAVKKTVLCESLGAADVATAAQLCLCSDTLSDRTDPDIVTESTLLKLRSWFEQLMVRSADPQLSMDAYVELVARVVGPATTVSVHCVTSPRVEVRTLWEAVSEVGERLARLVLTPAQLDLLTRAPRLICITGPPGTGKSVTLVLMGLEWLRQGHDVHVLSSYRNSLAASRLIYHQLRMTLQEDPTMQSTGGRVYLHEFDFGNGNEDAEKAIQMLTAAARDGAVHVLMDEIKLGTNDLGPSLHKLVAELSVRISRFCLWAALLNHNIPPDLQEELLTVPLRCAPIIVREVERGITWAKNVHTYTADGTPSPCDGPSVIRLRHEGEGHTGKWPIDCMRCGQEVAGILEQLRVGMNDGDQKTSSTLTPTTHNTTASSTAASPTTTVPPPLKHRDVFVLTRSHTLTDEITDSSGNVTCQASGFVRGLRDEGVPVSVLGRRRNDEKKWETGVADMAVARRDQVTVSDYRVVSGLERKVVVYLPGQVKGDDKQAADFVEGNDRLFALSRCTSQLVMVHVPEH